MQSCLHVGSRSTTAIYLFAVISVDLCLNADETKGQQRPKKLGSRGIVELRGGDPLDCERIAALPYVTSLAAIWTTGERQEGRRLSSDVSDTVDMPRSCDG